MKKLILDSFLLGSVGMVSCGVYLEFGLGYSLICGGCFSLALGLANNVIR